MAKLRAVAVVHAERPRPSCTGTRTTHWAFIVSQLGKFGSLAFTRYATYPHAMTTTVVFIKAKPHSSLSLQRSSMPCRAYIPQPEHRQIQRRLGFPGHTGGNVGIGSGWHRVCLSSGWDSRFTAETPTQMHHPLAALSPYPASYAKTKSRPSSHPIARAGLRPTLLRDGRDEGSPFAYYAATVGSSVQGFKIQGSVLTRRRPRL